MGTLLAVLFLLLASSYCQPIWNLGEIETMNDIHYHFCESDTSSEPFANKCPSELREYYGYGRPERDVYGVESLMYESDFEPYPELKIPEGSTICCEPCSCNVSSCPETKDCCPEYISYTDDKVTSIFECIKPELKQEINYYTSTEMAYNMITSCEGDISTNDRIDSAISDKCSDSAKYNSIFAIIPVSNIATNTIYLNRYCAYCNGLKDEDIIYWQPQVVCKSGQFTPRSMETIVDDLLSSDECNLITEPVTEERINECRYIPITKCNVTGKWVKYDPIIERACGAYTAVFQTIYRNVFCYLCNEIQPLEKLQCKPVQLRNLSFMTFLKVDQIQEPQRPNEDNLQLIDHMQQNTCANYSLFDPIQGRCVRTVCRGYNVFIDGRCINTLDTIAGIKNDVFFKITMKETPSDEHFTNLFNNLKGIFHSHLENNNITVFLIKMFMKKSENHPHTGFEFVVVFIQLSIPLTNPLHISVIESIYNFHNTTIYVPLSSKHNPLECFVEMDIFKKEIRGYNFSSPILSIIDYRDNVTLTESTHHNVEEDLIPEGQVNTLSPAQNCLLVELNASFYHITHYAWGIFIHELKREFKESEYEEDDSDTDLDMQTLFICREKIEPLFQEFLKAYGDKSGAKILSLSADILLISLYFISVNKIYFEI